MIALAMVGFIAGTMAWEALALVLIVMWFVAGFVYLGGAVNILVDHAVSRPKVSHRKTNIIGWLWVASAIFSLVAVGTRTWPVTLIISNAVLLFMATVSDRVRRMAAERNCAGAAQAARLSLWLFAAAACLLVLFAAGEWIYGWLPNGWYHASRFARLASAITASSVFALACVSQVVAMGLTDRAIGEDGRRNMRSDPWMAHLISVFGESDPLFSQEELDDDRTSCS